MFVNNKRQKSLVKKLDTVKAVVDESKESKMEVKLQNVQENNY